MGCFNNFCYVQEKTHREKRGRKGDFEDIVQRQMNKSGYLPIIYNI